MHRWAGLTDVAVRNQRTLVNPMLDSEFIRIARGLKPMDKARSRFLASLQMELDPDLGRIPLEGRSAPASYANPTMLSATTEVTGRGRRFARKAIQRLRRKTRPTEGASAIARAVVAHWRAHPELLGAASLPEYIRSEWIDEVLGGRVSPGASTVGFVTNLLIADA
jgi:asparagine synthase (glutamine-hydrolysing)